MGASALDAGFLEPALETGFLAFVDAGFADARDAGFSALEAGLADAALDAGFGAVLETGLEGAALDAGLALDDGFASALDAGLATALESGLAFFAGGASAPSSGAATSSSSSSSTSFSVTERFLPLADFGLDSFSPSSVASPSCPSAAGLTFFARGLAGGFLAGGPGFGCSFMRVERLGSAGAPVAAAASLRGIASSGWAGDK